MHLVEELQIVQGRAGRGDDVAAAVVPGVLLQLVTLARGRDELPQADAWARE